MRVWSMRIGITISLMGIVNLVGSKACVIVRQNNLRFTLPAGRTSPAATPERLRREHADTELRS